MSSSLCLSLCWRTAAERTSTSARLPAAAFSSPSSCARSCASENPVSELTALEMGAMFRWFYSLGYGLMGKTMFWYDFITSSFAHWKCMYAFIHARWLSFNSFHSCLFRSLWDRFRLSSHLLCSGPAAGGAFLHLHSAPQQDVEGDESHAGGLW